MTEEQRAAGRLQPQPLEVGMSVSEIIDRAFLGAAARQLGRVARLLTERVLTRPETLMGLSLDATLAPYGATITALTPLLRAGQVDWIAASGTNLYFDALHALGTPFYDPLEPPGEPWVVCGGGALVRRRDRAAADTALREILAGVDFQQAMASSELHARLGHQLRGREKSRGIEHPSLLSVAAEAAVPIYNPAPADNPLGSLIADLALSGNRLGIETSMDSNEAAAILNRARGQSADCAVWCLGRGASASFMLEAPAHLRAVLGCKEELRYMARVRMAGRAHMPPRAAGEERRDEGEDGIDLSLATNLSIALPLLSAYLLDRLPPRRLKRLGARRDELLDRLRRDRLEATLRRPAP